MKYLYKISPIVMVNRLLKKTIAPIYRHDVGFIILTYVFVYEKDKNNKGTECIVLTTPESLKLWEDKISNLIPVGELKKHLAVDKGGFVILATRPNSNGLGRKVVAYRKGHQRLFSHDWGIKGKLPTGTAFINHSEVLPEYRGQRISKILAHATLDYCRQNNIKKYFGVIGSHNQPSLKHSLRRKDKGRIIGKIELFSLLGGLYKHVTPWNDVKKIIEKS